MSKFTYSDGQEICVYNEGNITKFPSAYLEKYKENMQSLARSKEWKKSGTGAIFRGDEEFDAPADMHFDCNISGVFPTKNDNEVVYTFTVNNTSGIYKKNIANPKEPETHIINSNELQFIGGCLNTQSNILATSIKRNSYNSDIAIFNLDNGDYKTVTDGDTLDDDPFISPDNDNIIYYTSRGVGRDSHGAYAGLSTSGIYKLDLDKIDVEDVLVSSKFNYYKPIYHNGKLYAIKAPAKGKSSNPIIEIILIPWRILQGIAGFINIFVKAFSGKSITSGGNNPAKGRDYDGGEIEIKGNLINVEKQEKKNAGKKDKDYGFIPNSWQLVDLASGEVIKSGVADYDITDDGTFITTNGRRIFEIKDGKCKKIADADFCIKVNCSHSSQKIGDLFD